VSAVGAAVASRQRTWAQWLCLAGGISLIARGTIGVALDPAFDAPGEGWHQLFHLSSGVALVAAAGDARIALAAVFAFATVYGLVTIAGIVDGNDVAGVLPIEASDNRIHAVFTLVSLGVAIATVLRGRAGRARPG